MSVVLLSVEPLRSRRRDSVMMSDMDYVGRENGEMKHCLMFGETLAMCEQRCLFSS